MQHFVQIDFAHLVQPLNHGSTYVLHSRIPHRNRYIVDKNKCIAIMERQRERERERERERASERASCD